MFRHTVDRELTLRQVTPDDAPALFALIDEQRDWLRTWLPWVDLSTGIEITRGFTENALAAYHRDGMVTAVLVVDGAVGGVCGLHALDHTNKSTSLGYWLSRDLQGRGLMTRAVRALADHVFRDLRFHRLEIRCAVGNAPSRGIPTRLGFREEGVARGAELVNGTFLDLVVYAMLDDEWDEA